MELSKNETKMLKGIAIIFLLILHLFNTKNYDKLFIPLIKICNVPLIYYISLVAECCVPIFLFCSGYGLAVVNDEKRLNSKYVAIRILRLLINYWIILIIFVVIGYIIKNPQYPGSIKIFLLNFFLLSKSYNGAWWFLQSYVILVIVSKILINKINEKNYIITLFLSVIVYFIAFLQIVKGIIPIKNEVVLILNNILINFSNCQFSFIVGIVLRKKILLIK